MSTWALSHPSSPGNEVFRRPLGPTELGFYWDAVFAGIGDTLQHIEVDLTGYEHRELFSLSNLIRTWTQMKWRYPLLGSTIEERQNGDAADFVVEERHLRQFRPGEIGINEVNSLQEAEEFADATINGTRKLSSQLLSRIWILFRTDQWSHVHIFIHVSHVITDGLSNALMLRAFLDTLCSPTEPILPGLLQRLQLIIPVEALFPTNHLSRARIRWRRAIAYVLHTQRERRMRGGHTLPRILTPLTHLTPAKSRTILLPLPLDVSSRIIAGCRTAKITIGNAFPVIAQLAHSRILHRFRLQGLISDADWQERRQQPMNFLGTWNLRSHVCPDWNDGKGIGEVTVMVTGSYNTLPFMPTATVPSNELDNGAPPFSALLSKERFLLRSRIIKQQSIDYVRNPLFLELAAFWNAGQAAGVKKVADEWRELQGMGGATEDNGYRSSSSASHVIWSNSGSAVGNMNAVFPADYPRSAVRTSTEMSKSRTASETESSPKVMLHAKASTHRLRCRPMELYLGSYTTGRQMHLCTYWDANVYEESLVKEWLGEVKGALEWYLGSDDERSKGDIGKSRL